MAAQLALLQHHPNYPASTGSHSLVSGYPRNNSEHRPMGGGAQRHPSCRPLQSLSSVGAFFGIPCWQPPLPLSFSTVVLKLHACLGQEPLISTGQAEASLCKLETLPWCGAEHSLDPKRPFEPHVWWKNSSFPRSDVSALCSCQVQFSVQQCTKDLSLLSPLR